MATTFVIKLETGITINNIPLTIFDHMSQDSILLDAEGMEFKLLTETSIDYVKRSLTEFSSARFGRAIEFQCLTGIIIACLASAPPVEVMAAENEEVDRLEEETDGSEEAPDGEIVPSSPFVAVEVDRNTVSIFIASKMEDKITSSAKVLESKILELNKFMTRILNLRREITELTDEVNSNPIVDSLIEEAKQLTEEDNLVERAFFTKDLFVITTKNLSTDNIIDGYRRDIGQMAITVELKCLVNKISSEHANPVKIFNLTRQYFDGENYWQCGHVKAGFVCWGNAIEPLFEAIEKRDLLLIADIIIRFIKNPDPQDMWGQYIKGFPTIREE